MLRKKKERKEENAKLVEFGSFEDECIDSAR